MAGTHKDPALPTWGQGSLSSEAVPEWVPERTEAAWDRKTKDAPSGLNVGLSALLSSLCLRCESE